MARIRTIKPEFWTDEKVVEMSFPARLLFVGMWNFADDEGWLWDQPQRLKMQIFPADSVSLPELSGELWSAGLIEKWTTTDGGHLICLPHFLDHQKVSHATESKLRPLAVSRVKSSTHSEVLAKTPENSGALANSLESSALKGIEGKGIEGKGIENIAPKSARERDELFEAVAQICSIDWKQLTPSSRGALNKAVSEIREARGQPQDVPLRALEYRKRFNVALTPSALAKHWPSLGETGPNANTLTSNQAVLLQAKARFNVAG